MSHKDGRVVLSAWVDPVLRDLARVAARSAGVEFSRWIARAVQRAVADESAARTKPTALDDGTSLLHDRIHPTSGRLIGASPIHLDRLWREEADRVGAVKLLLEANGCDCPCDHHYSEHTDDCERCLACRIVDVVQS